MAHTLHTKRMLLRERKREREREGDLQPQDLVVPALQLLLWLLVLLWRVGCRHAGPEVLGVRVIEANRQGRDLDSVG